MSLGGWGDLLLWSILGQGNCLNSEDRDGGGVALRTMDRTLGLVPYPSEAVG